MEHQHLLDEINDRFNITVQFFSPRCSPWSKANTTSKVETKARARQEERPGLQWITQRCRQVLDSKSTKAFILETPHGSQLLTDSPFACIHKDKRTSSATLDQCQHGARDIDSRGLRQGSCEPQILCWRPGVTRLPHHGAKIFEPVLQRTDYIGT